MNASRKPALSRRLDAEMFNSNFEFQSDSLQNTAGLCAFNVKTLTVVVQPLKIRKD